MPATRRKFRYSVLVDELLTREVQSEVAQIHTRLYPRGPRSRRARRCTLPIIICARTTVVDVGDMLLLQPRCARRIFHVYSFCTHALRRIEDTLWAYFCVQTGRQRCSMLCSGGGCCRFLFAWIRVLNAALGVGSSSSSLRWRATELGLGVALSISALSSSPRHMLLVAYSPTL